MTVKLCAQKVDGARGGVASYTVLLILDLIEISISGGDDILTFQNHIN